MTPKSLLVAAVLAVSVSLAHAVDGNIYFNNGWTQVRFLGKSPNINIIPNTSLPSYIALKFSKFEERDPTGKKVNGHSVVSLAAATPTWTTGNYTAKNGANLTYVKMALDLINDPTAAFTLACPTNGNGRRSARRNLLAANPMVTVTLYFGGNTDATFNYGFNKTASVAKGGLKFSVEYNDWPFCADNNTLGMEIDLTVTNNQAANVSVSTTSDGTKVLAINLGNDYTSNIYFANYAYETSNGNRSMPVTVGLNATGTTSTVTLKLPNPTPNTTVYYDPTVTVTGTTATPGSAGALRVSFWAAAAALLLSLMLL